MECVRKKPTLNMQLRDANKENWLALAIWCARLLAGVAVAYALYVAIWAYANAVVPLYWDQWDNQNAYLAYNANPGGWMRWLFALHNEHRITIPRLFFLADVHVFGGSNRFLVFSILAVQGLCAWLGVRLVGRYVSRMVFCFEVMRRDEGIVLDC